MNRTVSLPEELVKRAEELANQQRVPLEVFLSARLEEQLADLEYLRLRGERSTREKFEAALAQIPDVEPEPRDAR